MDREHNRKAINHAVEGICNRINSLENFVLKLSANHSDQLAHQDSLVNTLSNNVNDLLCKEEKLDEAYATSLHGLQKKLDCYEESLTEINLKIATHSMYHEQLPMQPKNWPAGQSTAS